FSKIFREVSEDGRCVSRPPLERGNATRAAPTVAALHPNYDVFIEESAVLQKANCRLGSEFIRAKFADADEISQTLGIFRLSQVKERIQTMHFTAGRRFTILRERFELRFDELAKCAIFETFNNGAGSRDR